jgi:hypothetical protein
VNFRLRKFRLRNVLSSGAKFRLRNVLSWQNSIFVVLFINALEIEMQKILAPFPIGKISQKFVLWFFVFVFVFFFVVLVIELRASCMLGKH